MGAAGGVGVGTPPPPQLLPQYLWLKYTRGDQRSPSEDTLQAAVTPPARLLKEGFYSPDLTEACPQPRKRGKGGHG